MVESIFIVNLFKDTNITYIFYKSSQTYSTGIQNDKYLRTEGVVVFSVVLLCMAFQDHNRSYIFLVKHNRSYIIY